MRPQTYSSIDGYMPPQDNDLEMAILGGIVLEPADTIDRFYSDLKPEIFYSEQHRLIMSAISELFSKNKKIDILTVIQHLRQSGRIEEVGGIVYITQLTNRIASNANFEYHLRLVQQYYFKRELIRISAECTRGVFVENRDVFELIDETIANIEGITKSIASNAISSIRDIHISNIAESLQVAREGIESGVTSGIDDIDRLTNGWQNSDLIILAGRPGMGKTAAAIRAAMAPALIKNQAVLVFSLEMSKSQLAGRMESDLSAIDASKIIKKQLRIDEIRMVDEACAPLYNTPIFIDDTPNISMIELRARARRMKSEFGIRLIIVDYLQLMRSGLQIGNREQEISEISRGLKALAKELDIPVIALSQLSRAVEARADKKPMLSDLRESGSIEQDADMVLFCYRPEYYGIDSYEIEGESYPGIGLFILIVAKHRNGDLGEIVLRFVPNLIKVTNYSETPSTANLQYKNNSIRPSEEFAHNSAQSQFSNTEEDSPF